MTARRRMYSDRPLLLLFCLVLAAAFSIAPVGGVVPKKGLLRASSSGVGRTLNGKDDDKKKKDKEDKKKNRNENGGNNGNNRNNGNNNNNNNRNNNNNNRNNRNNNNGNNNNRNNNNNNNDENSDNNNENGSTQENNEGEEAGREESDMEDMDPFIVGGIRPLPKEYPFFASMYYNFKPAGCGGSLIARKWVLTAAHCAELFTKEQMELLQWRVGNYCTNGAENCGAPVSLRQTRKVFIHPDWDPVNITWDYALMKLDENVRTNRPVRIDRGSEYQKLREGDLVKSLGMGFVNDEDEYPEYLQEVNNLFLPLERCAADFSFGRTMDESVMCTSGLNFGNCRGDSGSPAVVASDESATGWIQVGVISFGRYQCENHDEADGLARVATAFDWIVETICPTYKPGERWTPNFCKDFVPENDDNDAAGKSRDNGNGDGEEDNQDEADDETDDEDSAADDAEADEDNGEADEDNDGGDGEGDADEGGNDEDDEEEDGDGDGADDTSSDPMGGGFNPFGCENKETFVIEGGEVRKCQKIQNDSDVEKYCSAMSTALRDCPVSCQVPGCV